MNTRNMLRSAISASQQACEKILAVYNTDFSFTSKQDSSPITLADTASNEIITNLLRRDYPRIPFLSEESDSTVPDDAEYCWIVDPLDGTKEFIKRNREFTVNIALVHHRKPVLGVIAVPIPGLVYFAAKGCGAFRQDTDGITQIHVSRKLKELIWVGSKTHSGEKEEKLIKRKNFRIKTTVQAGSSLKGALVAEGKADVYYRFGLTCEWDTCAMQCLVEEAGGIFRQMDGTEMEYNRKNHLNEKGFFAVNRQENIWL
jgi:3'(2'), 5'-bisphosphate nucleotidase